MNSIVRKLSNWVELNRCSISDNSIELIEQFPDTDSDFPWKASIGLVHNKILVTYNVWERSGFQTELIVNDIHAKKTICMTDKTPTDSNQVFSDLDEVLKKSIESIYQNMDMEPIYLSANGPIED